MMVAGLPPISISPKRSVGAFDFAAGAGRAAFFTTTFLTAFFGSLPAVFAFFLAIAMTLPPGVVFRKSTILKVRHQLKRSPKSNRVYFHHDFHTPAPRRQRNQNACPVRPQEPGLERAGFPRRRAPLPHRLPARPGPRHPYDRLPPPGIQDPGLRQL